MKTISPLTQAIRYFYTKEGSLPKEWQPYIINRYLSFAPSIKIQELSRKIDRITFITDKQLLQLIMWGSIPQQKTPWVTYIKKPTEKKEKHKPIIDMIQKYFKWTNQELESNLPMIMEQLEDKQILEEFTIKTGDESIIKKKKLVKPKKEVTTLGKWI